MCGFVRFVHGCRQSTMVYSVDLSHSIESFRFGNHYNYINTIKMNFCGLLETKQDTARFEFETRMGPSNEEINRELAERDNQDIKYNFVGKNVMMTGASSGIGKVIWKKLLRNGATVAAFGRNVAKLEAEMDDKMTKRGKFIPVVCDLAQPVDVEEKFYIIMSTEFEGKLDVLINSAGIMLSKDYRDTTLQEFDHIMTINVRAPMQLMSMAGPWLQETKGAVVNLSANAVPRPSCTLFSMSKSCLDMLTQCAALEMAKYGVRCNAVAPGVTNTPMRMSQPFGPMSEHQNRRFNDAM